MLQTPVADTIAKIEDALNAASMVGRLCRSFADGARAFEHVERARSLIRDLRAHVDDRTERAERADSNLRRRVRELEADAELALAQLRGSEPFEPRWPR